MPRSLLDLPLRARSVFFFSYLVLQIALLVRAQRSPDFVFGFQMFNASSDMHIRLFRQIRRRGRARLVPVVDGTWTVNDGTGGTRDVHWQDRVHDGVLANLDRTVHASYGLDAQLFRLQFALRDVVSHLPVGDDTEALVAVVETVKNGREPGRVRLRADRP
jgi:hypothetical protein